MIHCSSNTNTASAKTKVKKELSFQSCNLFAGLEPNAKGGRY